MVSQLANCRPLLVIINGQKYLSPMPHVLNKFNQLYQFLDLVIDDFDRALEPFQRKIDTAKNTLEGFIIYGKMEGEIIPIFLKCLFSYSFFFVAADKAYLGIEKEFNQIEDRFKIEKYSFSSAPQKSTLIENIQKVRNTSIGHIQGNQNFPASTSLFTRRTLLSWEPVQLAAQSNELPRLVNLRSFGKFNLRSK
ncbi:MAG: hypothetical protein IPM53_08630 [Anaerolineaceae bacterium]|nr:hypothetical protein [Anaerolineaceae bacterium]